MAVLLQGGAVVVLRVVKVGKEDGGGAAQTHVGEPAPRPACLGTLTTEAAGQVQVTGHDGDATAVDGAQVGVGQHRHDVGLGGLLEGEDSGAGEAESVLVVAGELANEALEGGLAEEQVGALLELADLAEGNGAGTPLAGSLLNSGGALGDLLGGDLAGLGGLAGGVLGAGHLG